MKYLITIQQLKESMDKIPIDAHCNIDVIEIPTQISTDSDIKPIKIRFEYIKKIDLWTLADNNVRIIKINE